jgi:hypothetical protein
MVPDARPNDADAARDGTEPLPDDGRTGEIDTQAIRDRSLHALRELGFRVADNLPLWTKLELRPVEEIAVRLMALDAVYTWAYAIEEKASGERLAAHAERNRLVDAMTVEDREIFQMPRAQAQNQFGNTVGWSLENMWPLAWILGFDPEPPISSDVIPESVANTLIMKFMPNLDGTVEQFLARTKPRPLSAIFEIQDLYYCAHNAVRNGQLGRDTVPAEFDLAVGGPIVHERRHSLTWSLSPGIAWDGADLST